MTANTLQPNQLEFFNQVEQAWQQQHFERIILSQYHGEIAKLEKITVRSIVLKDQTLLNVVYRYQTQDITKNYSWHEFSALLQEWLNQCQQINLFTEGREIQLKYKKGQWKLSQSKHKSNAVVQALPQSHDRNKKRWIAQDRLFLQLLGITDQKHEIIPSMARKWKQINKFVEIFAGAIEQAQLQQQEDLHVVDFGSGKGYLTCAVYDYLLGQHLQPHVTGVELREELVKVCQNVAQQAGYDQLKFFQGDVRSYFPEKTDVMIALHACDVATDFAIHTGIRLGAKVIMCAPCCHKELRPQLQAPQVLKPMLQFGVHVGQQAEMLTDTLRALLLQAYGYETKVLEFVSLEHTSKNKMILATRQQSFKQVDQNILDQVQQLKNFYGIEKHTLELLLKDLPVDQKIGCLC
ncbi:MAG: SAM-dependent methyltransferase [Acinetobacter populi]|jgi:SAM-dependent methyltransferase|uniref:class I SAM-dependent methyltransferase n=1 Tax=Acinetobacter populi TaxID=1582270 RepID=UPI0023548629|nr:SAM-dependent methyltransferase [Acinetobacter populi]MCH4246318.1 SAM-dependent methyltransferase [Acinetobacter populi]